LADIAFDHPRVLAHLYDNNDSLFVHDHKVKRGEQT